MYTSRWGGGRPYLVHIETHICDHCNLNCKACNNYSPFVNKRSPASLEQWTADIERLSKIYRIGRILLLGGEPLTEPELTKEFVKITRYFAPTSDIFLLTNGLLIPKMTSDFWSVLVNNNVILYMSIYPAVAPKMFTIVNTLENHGVSYVYQFTDKFGKRLTLSTDNDVSYNSIHCPSAACHYMRDGYIYKCPDASLIKFFDKAVGTNFESKCGISLDEAEKNPVKVLDKLIEPIDLCSYCNIKNAKPKNWEPVRGKLDIKDWLVY